jgi:hypothetical protein
MPCYSFLGFKANLLLPQIYSLFLQTLQTRRTTHSILNKSNGSITSKMSTYNYIVAKDILSEVEKGRIVCIYLNHLDQNNVHYGGPWD